MWFDESTLTPSQHEGKISLTPSSQHAFCGKKLLVPGVQSSRSHSDSPVQYEHIKNHERGSCRARDTRTWTFNRHTTACHAAAFVCGGTPCDSGVLHSIVNRSGAEKCTNAARIDKPSPSENNQPSHTNWTRAFGFPPYASILNPSGNAVVDPVSHT